MNEVLQLQPKLEDWSANHNFELVLVTTDSAAEVNDLLSQVPISAYILVDSNGEVFQQYHVQAIPTDILIDENGNVVSTFVGWSGDELGKLKSWVEAGSTS